MMLTEKSVLSASTSRKSLTVSDTPSSVIEPLAAIIAPSALRHADADAGRIAFRAGADDLGDGIDMAGDDMAAELVAEPQRPFEVEARALCHMAGGVRAWVSAETSTANQSSPLSTTVRQTPEQAIEAPRSTRGHVIAAGDGQAQVAALLDAADGADVGDDAGEHGRASMPG